MAVNSLSNSRAEIFAFFVLDFFANTASSGGVA
jgi:hypothetical protein